MHFYTPQKELVKKAQAAGISKRVLDEAKKALNVQSVKEGNQWYWQDRKSVV